MQTKTFTDSFMMMLCLILAIALLAANGITETNHQDFFPADFVKSGLFKRPSSNKHQIQSTKTPPVQPEISKSKAPTEILEEPSSNKHHQQNFFAHPIQRITTTTSSLVKSSPAKVSLAISAIPREALADKLQELFQVKKRHGFAIKKVYIHTEKRNLRLEYETMRSSELIQAMEFAPKVNVPGAGGPNMAFAIPTVPIRWVSTLPDNYRSSQLPMWLVEQNGKEFLFDGRQKLLSLFDHNGILLGESY